MESPKNKNNEPNAQSANANYNPANGNFQRTEEAIDKASKAGKGEMKKRKERTEKANTKPNRKKIN